MKKDTVEEGQGWACASLAAAGPGPSRSALGVVLAGIRIRTPDTHVDRGPAGHDDVIIVIVIVQFLRESRSLSPFHSHSVLFRQGPLEFEV